MRQYRRVDDGPRFSHNTVAVLEAFATAVIQLHRALESASVPQGHFEGLMSLDFRTDWEQVAYGWARTAVRAARMLTVREDYR